MLCKTTILIGLLMTVFVTQIKSQILATTGSNNITTGVPFLTICPDARSTGLGCSGAATTPDIYSQAHNPAKYIFYKPKYSRFDEPNYKLVLQNDTCLFDQIDSEYYESIKDRETGSYLNCIDSTAFSEKYSFALSYTPWLRELVDDINLLYLVGLYRVDNTQTISGSLRYFSLGDIPFMSESGVFQGTQNPNEYAIDLAYSKQLSKNLSAAVAFRYIHSDLTAGQYVNGVKTYAGVSYATDMGFFYYKKVNEGLENNIVSAGLSVSNIGSKISYTDGETSDFIPTNLKLGFGYTAETIWGDAISFSLDFNKLLVPTPDTTTTEIPVGIGDDRGSVDGIFTSFTDAPGGFKEELQEVTVSGGIEFNYRQNYFVRTGYFYENKNKGAREFFTFGLGMNLIHNKKLISLDLGYILTTKSSHPLSNTLQFSIGFNL